MAVKKRGRGRPKGSKNKVKSIIKMKRKRGRPKGSFKEKVHTESKKIIYPDVPAYKMIGICPRCDAFICSKDLVSKFIYVCKSCGKKDRTKGLILKKRSLGNIPISRKEYLKDNIQVQYHDMPAYGPAPVLEKVEDDDDD